MKKKKRQLDSEDAESLREVIDSRGWKLILERLEVEKTKLLARLMTDLDPIGSAKVRGQIAAIDTAVQVPDILIAEAREPKTT